MSIESRLAKVFLRSGTGLTAPELADMFSPTYSYSTIQTAVSRLSGAKVIKWKPGTWPHVYLIQDREMMEAIAAGGSWRSKITAKRENVISERKDPTQKYDFVALAGCFGQYSYRH